MASGRDRAAQSCHSSPVTRHSSLLRKRRVPLCLDLRARLPFRHRILLRDDVTDAEERADILYSAGEVPVLLHLVGRLVVVLARVLVALPHAVAVRLPEEVSAGIGIERWDALFRKLEMVGAVVKALLRLGVGTDHPAIRLEDSRQRVV